jgi:hypothetical protein
MEHLSQPAPPAPPAAPPTFAETIVSFLDDYVIHRQSIEEADALYEAAWTFIKRIEARPYMLLRAALAEAERDGEGDLYSEGAIFAAQAIDAAYPEFGGAVGAALDEQFERLDGQSRLDTQDAAQAEAQVRAQDEVSS